MKSQRTGQSPPVIEDLGDGTFYYNFEVVETEDVSEKGDVTKQFAYDQVRCSFPVNVQEIQQATVLEGYNHTVTI